MTAMVRLGMIATLTLIVPGSARTLNATEVEGLVVRESNASTACGPGPAAGRGCARVAVLLTAGFHNMMHTKFSGDAHPAIDPTAPLMAAASVETNHWFRPDRQTLNLVERARSHFGSFASLLRRSPEVWE